MQQLLLSGVEIEILVDAFNDSGIEASDLVNFAQKIMQRAVEWGQKDQLARLVCNIGNDGWRFSTPCYCAHGVRVTKSQRQSED